MQSYSIPAPLARAVMNIAPSAALQKAIDALMRTMRRDHPSLFRNLRRLSPALIRVEPSDVPHKFILSYGKDEASLKLDDGKELRVSACIKGKLEALLDLLEGRIDGDAMFFSRGIEITGDTAVIVALRNTIDREDINLLDDVTGMMGPFARPAKLAVIVMDKAVRSIRNRIVEICEEAQKR